MSGRMALLVGTAMVPAILFAGSGSATTLGEAVAIAVSSHPTVKAARYAERAAQEDINDAKADYLPSVDFNGDTGYQHTNNTTTRGRSGRVGSDDPGLDTWRKSAELTLSQTLFNGFDTKFRTQSAEKSADAAKFDLRDAGETIGLRAVQAYLAVLRNQMVLKLAAENLEKHRAVREKVKIRADQEGSYGDLHQTESRLSLAEARLAEVEGDLRESEAEYLEAVGEMPASLEQPVPLTTFPDDQDQAMAAAIDNNPALKAAALTVGSRDAEADASNSAFWPSVSLELSEARDWDSSGIEEPTTDRQAVVRLQYNFYKGGRDTARRKKALELAGEARERESETRRQVERQLRVDYNSYRTAVARLDALKKRTVASADAVEAYQEQFDIGQRTLLDVLDVENELFQAKVALVDGELQLNVAQYRVLATMGSLLSTLDVATATVSTGDS